MALNPILVQSLNSLIGLLIVNTLIGLTFSAFQLALFENLMEVVPSQNKTLNIAIYTTLINISGFASPMLGVWIYKMTSIHFAMNFSGILRFAATGLLLIRYLSAVKSAKTISLAE